MVFRINHTLKLIELATKEIWKKKQIILAHLRYSSNSAFLTHSACIAAGIGFPGTKSAREDHNLSTTNLLPKYRQVTPHL